ncbi:hypothetical protein V493_06153 [Pseudogymnoascus sp. VKM F-4281 (FW-2241)]|nr:hypothetical protein V493_06153 [Pseudogymnoascus sp. VKM F-4281 (FW-2241)]
MTLIGATIGCDVTCVAVDVCKPGAAADQGETMELPGGIVFTCGEHEFASELKGYEGVTCQCHNCYGVSLTAATTTGKPLGACDEAMELVHTLLRSHPTALYALLPRCRLSDLRLCAASRLTFGRNSNRQDVKAQHSSAGNEMQPPQGQPGPGQQPGWGPPQGQQQPGTKSNMTRLGWGAIGLMGPLVFLRGQDEYHCRRRPGSWFELGARFEAAPELQILIPISYDTLASIVANASLACG